MKCSLPAFAERDQQGHRSDLTSRNNGIVQGVVRKASLMLSPPTDRIDFSCWPGQISKR